MEKKPQRWWDFPAILCLVSALWVVVWRIQATKWTSDLYRLENLVLIGLLLGLFLGKSGFKIPIPRWMGIILTAFFVPWQVGLFIGEDIEWTERLSSLSGRLIRSFDLFIHNKPVQDPLLFLTCMAILYWGMSLTAGYMLTRHGKPWIPLFVAGLALVLIDHFDQTFLLLNWFDGSFILFTLLLISRVYFLHSRKEWDGRGAILDPDVGLNLGSTVFISGLLVILFAWNLQFFVDSFKPGTDTQERMNIAWSSIRNRLGNAVAGLRGTPVYEVTSYSNQISLGTGSHLGDELLFTVKVSAPRTEAKRYYWRGYSYDHYSFGTWQSTLEKAETLGPREWNLTLPDWIGRKNFTFTFMPESSLQRTIFAPDIPIHASRTSKLILTNLNITDDLLSLQAETPLQPGEEFSVDAWVSNPTLEQLQAADTNYPKWVTDRYLEVPENLPSRVHALAIQITGESSTIFDKASAVTQYLRKTITYQAVIPAPPSGREPIDWFLFDYKKGFCNYYASSEVLLLRSVGIPARLATGYAEGDGNATGDSFKVKAHASHAWPEVYFNNIGWVEFEPTSSEPETFFASSSNGNASNENAFRDDHRPIYGGAVEPPDIPMNTSNSQPIKRITVTDTVVGMPLLCLAIIILLQFALSGAHILPVPVLTVSILSRYGLEIPAWLDRWAWRSMLSHIEWQFFQMGWMLKMLGGHPRQGQTPAERVSELVKLLPITYAPANAFLDEYQKSVYSPYPADLERAKEANRKLWREVLSTRLKRVTGI